jgi:hypothetical protein
MGVTIKSMEYYVTTVHDEPGQAYAMLSKCASAEVNLLAFSATPISAEYTQLTLFPEHPEDLVRLAEKTGVPLVGPHRAFLIQGDDQLGALIDMGVTDGKGGYGYVLFVKGDDHEQARSVLGV